MGKYLGIVTVLVALGIGLAMIGAPRPVTRFGAEPDFTAAVKGIAGDISAASHLSSCFDDYDALILHVYDKDGSSIAMDSFCSAYGKGSARVIKDGAGRNYVFLEHSEGRGTNATTDYLSVFRLGGDVLHLVMKTQLEAGTGPSTRFGYSYWAHPTKTGLEITFVGRHIGENEYEWCCTPPDRLRTVTIDANYRVLPSPSSPDNR